MPLRDHFRPPVWNQASWEGFHGIWPGMMVLQLDRVRRPNSAPSRASTSAPISRSTFARMSRRNTPRRPPRRLRSRAPQPRQPGPRRSRRWRWMPTSAINTSMKFWFTIKAGGGCWSRRWRSSARRTRIARKAGAFFVAKCAALIQRRVCVSVVDLVTTRHFNLYTDLLDLIDQRDPAFGPTPPPIYSATCRGRKVGGRPRFETWAYALAVGRTLPTLPIWLRDDLAVALDLEAGYEEACRALRIR